LTTQTLNVIFQTEISLVLLKIKRAKREREVGKMTTLVVGAQWGDEGKGKITNLLAKRSDGVVRFHGGNNAGHTLYHKGQKFASHLVPSGMFNPDAELFIGRGVVLDLAVLNKEIEDLAALGISLEGRLYISPGCHIIMPYHKQLERLVEDMKGDKKTGTTGRGIGPVHADKVSYNGIRLMDLSRDPDLFFSELLLKLRIKNRMISSGLGGGWIDSEKTYGDLVVEYSKLARFIAEPRPRILELIKEGKNVLFEGAHGVLLDNDWGTYPYVSASSVLPGNINGGAGIPPRLVSEVIGVTKAYTTRVGNGPFPTELTDALGDQLRELGGERGTTTGRNRRCGWLDMVFLKYAIEVAGITKLAITKLDILDSLDEIKVCVAYEPDTQGSSIFYDLDNICADELVGVVPGYKTFPGWKESTAGVRTYEDLPKNAREYVEAIAEMAGVPISLISVGPTDEATIEI
jgi:adenylosuccinate synthase